MPFYFSYVKDEKYQDETEWCDKVVLRHPDECTWEDLTKTFECFLRACGFVFGDYTRLTAVTEHNGNIHELTSKLNRDLIKENTELLNRIAELENRQVDGWHNNDDGV